jgi:hypothetical protein
MKLITALLTTLFLITPALAQEQENTEKTFYTMNGCDRLDKVATNMAKYEESVLATGTIVQFHMSGQPYFGHMMFQVNQDTGTWSLISMWPDQTVCVVAVGKEFAPWSGQKNETTY